jgi:hypothetical protein
MRKFLAVRPVLRTGGETREGTATQPLLASPYTSRETDGRIGLGQVRHDS